MKWKQATDLVGECERGLRRLLGEAATEGDYPAVTRITELARALELVR